MRVTKYLVCVDNRDESRIALAVACLRARARGSMVDMLHVIPPADFQTLSAVADKMREEQRAETEQLLKNLANDAIAQYGISPNMLIREGQAGDEIIQAAMSDSDISMVVIGVAPYSNGRGNLTSWLASQLGGKLLLPLLMVPGNLTEQQLHSLV